MLGNINWLLWATTELPMGLLVFWLAWTKRI